MQLGDLTITHSIDEFLAAEGPKVNYSHTRLIDGFWIKPYGNSKGFLWENDIKPQEFRVSSTEKFPIFFQTDGDLAFDILAASFFLLSRYEEYLPHSKDEYGRYAHQNSIAYKSNFLHLPLVNMWAKELLSIFRTRWPIPQNTKDRFSFLPTYDIDIAWSFKHKGLIRNTGAIFKSLITGRFSDAAKRIRVLRGKEVDPFDSFNWLDRLHAKFNLKPYYFFLLANKLAKYDRNISPSVSDLHELIRHHALHYPTGIHPSWQSNDDPQLLKNEIATLSKITGHQVLCSRQHFIRFNLPETFRHLIDSGILFDFSMGYGTINGFRASVASPYYWYDLKKEEQTELMLFPFCYMEANSFYELHHSPEEAYAEMKMLYNSVKEVNGTFTMIWHNSYLGTDPLYAGWREVYERFVKEVIR